MLKRVIAAAMLSLMISTPSAEALDLKKVGFYTRRAIILPVYVAGGFIAGPILGVMTWAAVGKVQANAEAVKAALKAEPLKKKEVLEAPAK